MACERYANELNDAAAGASPSIGLKGHLAVCADCRAQLVALRRVLAVADQEMAGLSTAEPSANFVPRLRAAVIESGSRPAWRAGWLWPSLATATVLVMALVIMAHRSPHETVVAVETRMPETAPVRIEEPIREPLVANTQESSDQAPQPRNRKVRGGALAEPEVLVPTGESQTLLRLVALANRNGLVPPVLGTADQPSSAELTPLPPISIKPLEIVPLDPARNTGT